MAAGTAACEDVRSRQSLVDDRFDDFDNRSLALNDETTLMILDAGIGRQMTTIFQDDLRDAKEFSSNSGSVHGLSGLLELGARFLSRLL